METLIERLKRGRRSSQRGNGAQRLPGPRGRRTNYPGRLTDEARRPREARRVARRELAALEERRERIEHLEQDANALLEHYASMGPEALDDLTLEERHHLYKMMRLPVVVYADELAEVTGAIGGLLDTPGMISVKTERASSSTATSPTSPRRGSGSPTTWR